MLDCKDFNEDNIFQDGNVIELRSGAKYEIMETIFVNCYEAKKRYYALSLDPQYIHTLTSSDWDYNGFHGCSAYMDIVRVTDKDGNLLGERLEINKNTNLELSFDESEFDEYFKNRKMKKQRGVEGKDKILEWHRENNAEKRIRKRTPVVIP